MVVPLTVNRGFFIPNTGDLPGTWGSDALNPDFVALDGILGGFRTLSLTTGTTTLTVPSGFVATPGAGPTQSQNAMLTFTGTLSGPCTITFPMPGFYIVQNLCVVGAYYIKLQSTSPGNVICAPPGEAIQVFCDGTSLYYVNLGHIGSELNLTTATVPAWVTNCTVPPYLNADGSVFSAVTYPTLAALLGGTTLPDYRGRMRVSLDGGTDRLTTAGSGVNGNTLLATGGAQNVLVLQANLPVVTLTTNIVDPGHNHPIGSSSSLSGPGSGTNPGTLTNVTSGNRTTGITASTPLGGSATPLVTVPPVQVGGLTLIRAA